MTRRVDAVDLGRQLEREPCLPHTTAELDEHRIGRVVTEMLHAPSDNALGPNEYLAYGSTRGCIRVDVMIERWFVSNGLDHRRQVAKALALNGLEHSADKRFALRLDHREHCVRSA